MAWSTCLSGTGLCTVNGRSLVTCHISRRQTKTTEPLTNSWSLHTLNSTLQLFTGLVTAQMTTSGAHPSERGSLSMLRRRDPCFRDAAAARERPLRALRMYACTFAMRHGADSAEDVPCHASEWTYATMGVCIHRCMHVFTYSYLHTNDACMKIICISIHYIHFTGIAPEYVRFPLSEKVMHASRRSATLGRCNVRSRL
jgi:hypothetical protein